MAGQLVRGFLLTGAVLAILIGVFALASRDSEGAMGVFLIAMGAAGVYWLSRWRAAMAAQSAIKAAATNV